MSSVQSIIIEGQKDAQERYMGEFLRNKEIKTYNVLRFSARVKIEDVRTVRKFALMKGRGGEARVVILPGDITQEAQNALLKLLEEVPPFFEIIICTSTRESLLPTVVSRCQIVTLTASANRQIGGYEEVAEELLHLVLGGSNQTVSVFDMLATAEQMLNVAGEKSSLETEAFILSLRNVIWNSIYNREEQIDDSSFHFLFELVKRFHGAYPFLVQNNVNKRFTFEALLLESLRSKVL